MYGFAVPARGVSHQFRLSPLVFLCASVSPHYGASVLDHATHRHSHNTLTWHCDNTEPQLNVYHSHISAYGLYTWKCHLYSPTPLPICSVLLAPSKQNSISLSWGVKVVSGLEVGGQSSLTGPDLRTLLIYSQLVTISGPSCV